MSSSRRYSAASVAGRCDRCTPMATAAAAAATTAMAIPNVGMSSDLDLDHAEDDCGAGDHRRRRTEQHCDAPAVVHGLHVAGVDDLDCEQEEHWKGAEYPCRDATLGGEHHDFATYLLAGPDEVGERVQEVGQL